MKRGNLERRKRGFKLEIKKKKKAKPGHPSRDVLDGAVNVGALPSSRRNAKTFVPWWRTCAIAVVFMMLPSLMTAASLSLMCTDVECLRQTFRQTQKGILGNLF